MSVTGELDATTIEMMTRRRCGVRDDRGGISYNSNGKRKKRFALAGKSAKHNHIDRDEPASE